jgi:hypothetical protein
MPPSCLKPTHTGHWVFTGPIQSIIQQKCILFQICHTQGSGDKSLQAYENSTARTVLVECCNLSPQEGEVIVNVVKCGRSKQMSIHPRYLVPSVPVISDEVVVIKGAWLGTTGVVRAREYPLWVVTLTVNGDPQDKTFEDKDLAPIESHRKMR